jgi:hypothetical protein
VGQGVFLQEGTDPAGRDRGNREAVGQNDFLQKETEETEETEKERDGSGEAGFFKREDAKGWLGDWVQCDCLKLTA